MSSPEVIDVHAHFFPKSFIDLLQKRNMLREESGRVMVKWGSKRSVAMRREHFDLGIRLKELEKRNFATMEILSISIPFIHFLSIDEQVKIARSINNEMAEISRKYPSKFRCLGILPLGDEEVMMEEAERSSEELGLVGFIFGTGIGQRSLADYGEALKALSKINKPIFIHPGTLPLDSILEEPARVGSLVSYIFETTYVISRLVLEGLLNWTNMKVIVPHGGGFIPYQVGRIDLGFTGATGQTGTRSKPSEIFKKLYYDTVVYTEDSLNLLLRFAGKDNVIFGSDYPYDLGRPELIKRELDSIEIPETTRRQIFYTNAIRLFEIE